MMGTEGLPEPYTARRRPLYLIEGALDSDRPLQAQALTGPSPYRVYQALYH
jgi:hypothetical protein